MKRLVGVPGIMGPDEDRVIKRWRNTLSESCWVVNMLEKSLAEGPRKDISVTFQAVKPHWSAI